MCKSSYLKTPPRLSFIFSLRIDTSMDIEVSDYWRTWKKCSSGLWILSWRGEYEWAEVLRNIWNGNVMTEAKVSQMLDTPPPVSQQRQLKASSLQSLSVLCSQRAVSIVSCGRGRLCPWWAVFIVGCNHKRLCSWYSMTMVGCIHSSLCSWWACSMIGCVEGTMVIHNQWQD